MNEDYDENNTTSGIGEWEVIHYPRKFEGDDVVLSNSEDKLSEDVREHVGFKAFTDREELRLVSCSGNVPPYVMNGNKRKPYLETNGYSVLSPENGWIVGVYKREGSEAVIEGELREKGGSERCFLLRIRGQPYAIFSRCPPSDGKVVDAGDGE